ncbi:Alcohol dehydrogenase [hydrothermal vent metagenome]|uniref:Alcohol dehydrogenase n=1 Tax=hydrothermal vent metagenome TaxID=652676 RepID=A0A3B0Y407_9ZZZZ
MLKITDITILDELQANWNYPAPIRFGVGSILQLADACEQLNINKPLLVTDAGLVKQDFIQEIIRNNKKAGIETTIFSGVKPNPTGENIEQGVRVFNQAEHDGVIAVGGGSALDAGKAIALMVKQRHPIWDFEDTGENWRRVDADKIVPLIAVPTTAGTGSEVGRSSVIVDEASDSKKIIFHPNMMPDIVIEDPVLSRGLPSHITAATGIDAFVHCLEAWCTPAYHPMADGIALEGMRLIKQWLPVAFNNGEDMVARSHMLVASSMGATAFQKGLGGIHALAHPLGALYDKHHGLLNAILLPYVLRRNKPAIENKINHLAHYLQLDDISFNGFMNWVIDFRAGLNIQNNLSLIDIDLEKKALVGRMATEDACALGNPVKFSALEYSQIFECAVKGVLK